MNGYRNKTKRILLIAAILVGAFELRCPITGVGSLVPLIRDDLSLSHAIAGMITTIPLMAFGVCSMIVSQFLKRFQAGHMVLTGICLIGTGIVIRSFLGTPGLFLGTVIIGVGISIGNVITPAIIKAYFPEKVGVMTSTYTALMAVFSSIASLLAVTLASHLGWRLALFVWILIPVIALGLWIPNKEIKLVQTNSITGNVNIKECKQEKDTFSVAGQPKKAYATDMQSKAELTVNDSSGSILKDSMSWWIAVYMGVQTLFFYCFVSWFATILQSKGYSAELAGIFNSCYMLMGIPGSFTLPVLAAKRKNQSGLGIGLGVVYVIGLTATLYAQNLPLLILAILCCGYCQGACFSFVMVLFGLHTKNAADTSALSGFSQSFGYLLASVAPTTMGLIFDYSHDWNVPLKILIVLAIVLTFLGYMAGRDKMIKG